MSSPVNLTPGGPPETILDPEPGPARDALARATAEGTREMVAAVVRQWPQCLEAWAELGDRAGDEIEAYACYRVGYHRGLDRLRQSGWRGSGYVRWRHETNRGFLRCLDGLERMASTIGEDDEAARCAQFLRQLDPDWDHR